MRIVTYLIFRQSRNDYLLVLITTFYNFPLMLTSGGFGILIPKPFEIGAKRNQTQRYNIQYTTEETMNCISSLLNKTSLLGVSIGLYLVS